ncbi:MAG: hypothetical protein IJ789_07765 [Bacteroidales bacterium]|nr:hypothetical protein [Bacteroidales bacterium]
MNNVEEKLKSFYSGEINQADLAALLEAFATSAAVRERWPADADLLLPLALARRDLANRRRPARHLWRRVAAAAAVAALVAGLATVVANERQLKIYSTDSDCDLVCAESWLTSTLETAL